MTNKKLYRIPSEGMIGGICAGLGDYFEIDPTIIRLVFILLFFAGFSGGLIYLIMWLIVPIEPADQTYIDDSEDVS